jgi:hypothetical protein
MIVAMRDQAEGIGLESRRNMKGCICKTEITGRWAGAMRLVLLAWTLFFVSPQPCGATKWPTATSEVP